MVMFSGWGLRNHLFWSSEENEDFSYSVPAIKQGTRKRDKLYVANNASECTGNNSSEPVNIQQF